MTVFFPLLHELDKAVSLQESCSGLGPRVPRRFDVDPMAFRVVPSSPFAYWAGADTLRLFVDLPALESGGRCARLGMSTKNDFRFLRLSWERTMGASRSSCLRPYAKGGEYSRFYADIHLLTKWAPEPREIEAELLFKYPYLGSNAEFVLHRNYPHMHAGLTWSRRSQLGLSLRALPAGCVFGDKGPGIFVDGDDEESLETLLAVTNSRIFVALTQLQMAFGSYEVGVIQRTPVPDLGPKDESDLGVLARRAWSVKRSIDTRTEISHAFLLPALLQVEGETLASRATMWTARVAEAEAELERIQTEIDARCFELYDISEADRRAITEGSVSEGDVEPPEEVENESAEAADTVVLAAELIAWAVGVAFGRFDVRLATGEREALPVPGPFEALPVCPAAMLTGEDGLPLALPPAGYAIDYPFDGVLVDDPGHGRDLHAAVQSVFETVFEKQADALLTEAASLLDPKKADLRAWLARSFSEFHLKRHSKSRRRAPMLWQLATPSARYSVWLYAHRMGSDSLFRLRADVVDPKLAVEERRLASLIQEAGPTPTASQGKNIAEHSALVEELRSMRDEIARVAPLWDPNLDDGVAIMMSPLWRLVPQHRAWQRELRTTFDALAAGKYDWAHLAMHLWPKRVVRKCAVDRSLAIAHGLEDVFWALGTDGTWGARTTSESTIEMLIADRTSPAAADALRSLLEAPVASGGPGRTRKAGETS